MPNDELTVIEHENRELNEVLEYWTSHNVTSHWQFSSPEESLEFLAWRNDQYVGYIDLMPVAGHDGMRILDYGCGPGHDLVGFGQFSRDARVIGADLSRVSLDEARSRLNLHGFEADLVQIAIDDHLPFTDGQFDLVHCSGVLHHTPDPLEFCGSSTGFWLMVDMPRSWSITIGASGLYLYVAYVKRLVDGLYQELDMKAAFARTTDGEDCPIARPYTWTEFEQLCNEGGFDVVKSGAAISVWELSLLPRRFEAIMNCKLPSESRTFLSKLTFDSRCVPHHEGLVAGVDLCFTIKKSGSARR